MAEPIQQESDDFMGVVGVKAKSNWLRHLAPADGRPGWESRHVVTLCGQAMIATGQVPPHGRTGARDRFGFFVIRRDCGRCIRRAEEARIRHGEGAGC